MSILLTLLVAIVYIRCATHKNHLERELAEAWMHATVGTIYLGMTYLKALEYLTFAQGHIA